MAGLRESGSGLSAGLGVIDLAAADRSGAIVSAAFWVLLIIVAAVVLLVIALAVKKRFGERDAVSPDVVGAGFTIGDLRRMRDSGEMSDEEYERARERIVAAAKRRLEEDAQKQVPRDRAPADAPLTKDIDLIRDAEKQ
jgi:hypothetical protein